MRYLSLLVTYLVLGISLVAPSPIELGGRSGSIRSGRRMMRTPGRPAQETYPNNVNMTWKISVRPGHRVALYFSDFDIEDSYDEDKGGACVYDYVEIAGHKLCGNNQHFPSDAPRADHVFRSDGDTMVVKFVTDYSNEVDGKYPFGFVGHYSEEDINECRDLEHAVELGVEGWDELLFCDHHCHNVPGSYYCTCRPGYSLHANQHTCVADCVDEQTAEREGTIESDDYPNLYGKLSDCETTLHAGRGKWLDIRFEGDFGIEDHYEEGCVYDWLKLTNDQGEEGVYCGNSLPRNGSWFGFNTSTLVIYFHSDLTIEKSGYRIRYRTRRAKCYGVLNPPMNGGITSRSWNGTAQYEDEIHFACNIGYRLGGEAVSTCNEHGVWSSPTPTCHIKRCPRPDDLLQVVRTNPPLFQEEERDFNSSIIIPCVQWYEMVSGATEWYCGEDENWHWRGTLIAPNNNRNFPECRPQCGMKNVKPSLLQQQIVGGRNSRYGEWPWIAFIDRANGLEGGGIEGVMFCGGSLVSEQYVVTAAHCLNVPLSRLRVYLGVTNRFNLTSDAQKFTVELFTNHRGHRANLSNFYDHDIAVIKLSRPAVIGRYVGAVRPICIPRSPIEVNLPLQTRIFGAVIGWGRTGTNNTAPILQKARVPHVNHSVCVATFNRQSRDHIYFENIKITENQFCAGFLNAARDSCNGDSGGPLMWRNQRRWYLNGIVSFGTKFKSCDAEVLGVYTNVSNYHDFLDNNIIVVP